MSDKKDHRKNAVHLKAYDKKYFEERGFSFDRDYLRFKPLAEAISRFGARRVCDIGASYGALVKALLDMGVDAYGVDVSEYAISLSPVKERLRLADIALQTLPFKDETFDFVTAVNVLEHLPSLNHGLHEIYRITKQRGLFYVSVPSEKASNAWSDPYHFNILTKNQWLDSLIRSGFWETSLTKKTLFWYHFLMSKIREKSRYTINARQACKEKNILTRFLVWQRSSYRFLICKSQP